MLLDMRLFSWLPTALIVLAGVGGVAWASQERQGDVAMDPATEQRYWEWVLRGADNEKVDEVRALIDLELQVGDSMEDVEVFFDKYNLGYTWDPYARRYGSVIRNIAKDPKLGQAIRIHIYIDDNNKYINYDVQDFFVSP